MASESGSCEISNRNESSSESAVDKTDSSLACGTTDSVKPESESNRFEYETQHFGFTPITLLNGMFNSVCDLYRDALKAFCGTCTEKYPNAMTEEQLRKARHEVGKLIDRDISMIFDTLEYYLLHQVFTIPENVVLPEDRCQLQQLNDGGLGEEIEGRINQIRKRIIAVKHANAVLRQHLEDTETFQTSCDEVLEQLSSAEGDLAHAGGKTLKDWISYYSEMLQKGVGTDK